MPWTDMANGSQSAAGSEPAAQGKFGRFYLQERLNDGGMAETLAHAHGFDVETPFKELPKDIKKLVLFGEGGGEWGSFEGVVPNLERRFRETESEFIKTEINKYMSVQPCPECGGMRLKAESLMKMKSANSSNLRYCG